MKDNIEKSLKRWLKRKVSVTLGVMVAFMITGGVVYSNDGVINETVSISVDEEGNIKVTPEGAGVLDGNTWTNSGKIDVANGNGVIIDRSVTADKNFSLINNGIVLGNSGDISERYSSEGNGINLYSYSDSSSSTSTLDGVTNNGIILGNSGDISERYSSEGNGINLYSYSESYSDSSSSISTLNGVTNNGIISGNSGNASFYSSGGNGINLYSFSSSNSSSSTSTLNGVTNNGIMSGNSGNASSNSSEGNGISIYSYSYPTSTSSTSILDGVTNNGIILGNSGDIQTYSSGGNGISVYSYSYSFSSSSTSTLKELNNNGIISGNSGNVDSISSGGNGISVYSNNGTATIEKIINSGLIMGNHNGIYVSGIDESDIDKSGITGYQNYGIVAGDNPVSATGFDDIKSAGFGLAINLTLDGESKITGIESVTAGADGEQEIGAGKKYIINGVENSGENATATAIKSSELKDKITVEDKKNYYDENFKVHLNLIINVVGDKDNSLVITRVDGYKNSFLILEDSVVNGYKTAIKFENDSNGSTFNGNRVTINGGENAFLGSDGVDKIYLNKDANQDTVKSLINGNISLGGGADILDTRDTTINGNVDMGEGADIISLISSTLNGDITASGDSITMDKSNINGNSTLTNSNMTINSTNLNGDITSNGGKITISGGNNQLFNVGASTINGNITITDGEIYVKDGSMINGSITLNGNKATVWLDKNQVINGNITVDESVTQKILGVTYSINSDEDMTALKNQSDKFSDFNLKLANGGNSNIDLTDLNINSITGGSGVDIFKTTVAGLTGKTVDGGEGSDTLNLIDNITAENQSSLNFSNVTDVETLQLADGGNTLDVSGASFKTIIGGNGDDIFNGANSDILLSINGGEGTDTINMGSGTTLTNKDVNKIFGENSIESLNLKDNNEVSLENLDYVDKINFGTGTNNLTLGKENRGVEFNFTQTGLINGNVDIDLNGNNAIVNSTSNGTTVTISKDFIVGDSVVTLDNGNIKLNLSQNTDFSNGVDTTLTLDKNGVLGEKTTVETYAFLKIDGETITVKNWEELSGDSEVTDTDKIIYDNIVKDFSSDGVYGALTKWDSESIVNWITQKGGEVLGNYTFEDNGKSYTGIVSSGILTVDTGVGGKLQDFSIKDLSSKGFVIKNNTTEGDGKVSFTGNTVVEGDIINSSTANTNLIFGGKTTVGNIDSSTSTAGTIIDITNKFSSDNIVFNDKEGNSLNIDNSSNINKIGAISGKVDIVVASVGENSDGFNRVLIGANSGYKDGSNSIKVTDTADGLKINQDYKGELTFEGDNNNIVLASTIGKVIMGNGADIINLDTSFADDITVNIVGGDGADIFNIGSPVSTLEENINQKLEGKTLAGTIDSFETMNIHENINFASDLDIIGTENITIGNGKTLGLNVDYSQIQDGKVTGHALYNKGIVVDNENGNILIGASTANEDAIISMGTDNSSTITNGDNILVSDSLNHDIEYDKDSNEVKVSVKKDLELGSSEAIKYSHLNEIYKSIVEAGKISLMAPSSILTDKTEAEAIQAQIEFYGKIYSSSPYAYSSDISKQTAELINNSIMETRFKADEGKWLHYGAIAGQGYDDENSYYGRGYYQSADIGKSTVDIDSDIYGAYYMGEYGKTQDLALGYVIAGNKSNTDIGDSSLNGNGYYLGTYAKYDINNFRLIAGVGYQHNYYEADRKVSNKYQAMSTSKKYTDDTLTAYTGARYIYNLSDSVTLEPFAKLNLTYVMQGDIKEQDNKDLSIEVEDENFTFVDSEIGVEAVKNIPIESGKINLKAGVSGEFALTGYDKEHLSAKITGSSKSFDIVSEENDRAFGKVSLGVEYIKDNGVFYTGKGVYKASSDEDSVNVEFGIGYKF